MSADKLLVIATLLPLVSFVILLFLGKKMGNPLAGWVGTFFIAGSFACSLVALISWLMISTNTPEQEKLSLDVGNGKIETVRRPILNEFNWLPVGNYSTQGAAGKGFLNMGVYVDSLTITMFAMITLVATAVHVFSLKYMAEEPRFARFYTYLSLFCFSMLGLVLGGTILQIFVFWELVGLCSYLLIGFWYEKKSASNAAIKAFVVNRVGDFGFLIGLGILFYNLGNVTLPDIWRMLDASKLTAAGITLPNGAVFSTTLLTIMGIGLFFGAVGKSAQFPLHVWLPDAMEGPTPVSALIHAATMVAAGVYLVGRIFPLLTPDARLFIAIIGATTLTMAALIAVVQSDIKKVLAFSTLSQLGYMVLAMGIGSWVGALFHLITHAFFKALLFLGSGSVIHAAHHEQEMPQYGGLLRKIPITAITFAIAVFAIAGTGFAGIGFSGYYSKDMIVANAGAFSSFATSHGRSGWYWMFFILPAVSAYVTAFYMTRCWMLTFWGKPRNQHVYDHAHEQPTMYLPLVVLAVLSIIGGSMLAVKEMLVSATHEQTALVRKMQEADHQPQDFGAYSLAWPADAPAAAEGAPAAAEAPHAGAALSHEQSFEKGESLVKTWVGFAFLIGIGAGFLMYMNGLAVGNALLRIAPLKWIHTWLYRRMYFDELYKYVLVSVTMGLAVFLSWFDKYVVDGAVNAAAALTRLVSSAAGSVDKNFVDGAVNGVASMAQDLGAVVRAPQTGRIRAYVAALLLLVAAVVAAAILVAVSH